LISIHNETAEGDKNGKEIKKRNMQKFDPMRCGDQTALCAEEFMPPGVFGVAEESFGKGGPKGGV